ncbi:NADP-dependent 3-hydroxy acid dehydrogenase YdfG [Pseudonocardia hierapolitana]|uniref:NADP-dependent 3-hydroxy acid dehydrogenase YdfG n=1 Tax=Pseudonocardia hierapolitana TaxID=1128676 RepID=A0A561SIA5_9PSEU|nr:SDR family oxidoreductase [Pseudonocardia hierapolitana]TWF74609.1 NADP-dependent 3-hydroxy acid dehydrogenase YdfG [Pseudonocardia hierapolitana]
MTQTSFDLTGRIAVVTGASSGIGAATARALAAGGAKVAVLARRTDRIEALAKEIDGIAVPADVTDPASLARAATTIRAELGRPDLVVANAGVMNGAPFATAEPAEWSAMVDTNVTGLLHTGKAFVDDLLAAAAEGRPADLVHVGSIASHEVFPGYAVYSATKAGVAALTRGLRLELGPRGVRVRAVEPGITESELGETMLDAEGRATLEDIRQQVGPIPASDVAEAIAWSAAAPARLNVAQLIVLPTAQG